MEWQAIVLVMQILMLAVGWFLFQQARGELSARAAETPILGEVKALQKSIKQLLLDLVQTSDRTSAELEAHCKEARELMRLLDMHLAERDVETKSEAAFIANRRMEDRRATEQSEWPPLTVVTEPSFASALAFQHSQKPQPSSVPVSNLSLPGIRTSAAATADTRTLLRERIFQLADDGLATSDIARETTLSEGEIETLLGLRLQRA